jgi:hypothetical protein
MKYALGGLVAVILVAVFVWFYIDSRSTPTEVLNQSAAAGLAQDVDFKILDQGTGASGEPSRKNYAIYTSAAFTDFWNEAHVGEKKPMPLIDFNNNYVIAVFAGTVPTQGYAIAISKIREENGTRSVAVTITEPGEECNIIEEPTSPFQFVQVPLSDAAAFTHTDFRTRTNCR